ncbi:hypothetical protein GIB67_020759 [Kingdonia uniflora]|uniref:Adaptor protein ClpS core domain-containing protein n=1 Tax=Kingdonia uniflora TaxID=39325 RepID=A0A7J7M737_9MAGN|nr:hypothetical protein GIB67_020759 [Kingdonia uniflora]
MAASGGDIGKMKQRIGTRGGGSYRVLMIDDVRHSETFVAKFLPKAVPAVTSADARNIFHKSRILGAAVVLVTVKEHAEFYAHMMLRGGLKSAIEPDSDTA